MSKNKNYHNYTNYSNNNKSESVEKETTNVETEVIQETTPNTETPVQEEPATPQPTKLAIGVVSGCNRLRVRAAASINAEVLCEIESGSEVTIDEQNSTKDFYKVTIADINKHTQVKGFCMKRYIVIV